MEIIIWKSKEQSVKNLKNYLSLNKLKTWQKQVNYNSFNWKILYQISIKKLIFTLHNLGKMRMTEENTYRWRKCKKFKKNKKKSKKRGRYSSLQNLSHHWKKSLLNSLSRLMLMTWNKLETQIQFNPPRKTKEKKINFN